MRRYTIYNLLTVVVAGLCLCGLFTACGEDRGGEFPDDDPNHCVVTITLRTSRSVRPPQTKAGGMMTKADETMKNTSETSRTGWWWPMMRMRIWPDIYPAKMEHGLRISVMRILVLRWR